MSFGHVSRAERRELERENARQPTELREVPQADLAHLARPPGLVRVLRSREFMVQVFAPEHPSLVARLSINRTQVAGERWRDGITWDDLQRLKAEAGYADCDAVEVYPPARDLVNVGNMRHLWVLAEPVPFAWRARRSG